MRTPRFVREQAEAVRAAILRAGYVIVEAERIAEVLQEQGEPVAAE
jgi:hypothetical protein